VTVTLRPYQSALIASIRDEWVAGNRNVLAVMPTGAGKTVTFSALNADNTPSCTIVHRQELVGQISATYARTGIRHNIIAPQPVINFCIAQHVKVAGRSFYDPRATAHVAGVDTLIRRFKPGDRWCDSIRRWTCDEAHHLRKSNKWGTATTLFPHAQGLGVTATPVRADRLSLHADQGGLFHALVQGPGMRDLIQAGALCDYRVIAPQSGIDEAMLKLGSTGDFTAASTKAARKAELIGDIVETYQQHTPGARAIVFAISVQDARDIAARFNDAGIRAEALDATSNDAHRQQQVEAFASGRVSVLTNVDLFGEGFDIPACDVVIMARPTASFGLFVQQFGRALRPAPGKSHGTIIDHVGNVVRMAATHGLPDTPRRWSLWSDESRRQTRDPDAVPVRVCDECALVYEAVRMDCPYCGHCHTPAQRGTPEQVDGILSEMSPELLERLRMQAARHTLPEPAIPYGASEAVVAGIRARHRRNQAAQASLTDAMQQWGGVRLAAGDDDTAMQARFLHRFGVDVLSAQGLPERAALELRDAIMESLT
jgi:superfamily II DNA or RNA helicase